MMDNSVVKAAGRNGAAWRSVWLSGAALLAAPAFSGTAAAQERDVLLAEAQITPVSYEEESETVVVTGSRFERTILNSTVPVDVLSEDTLQQTGRLNVRDALQQILPSYNNSAGWTGGSGEAVKAASLRGLGADQTLVLVNGVRRHPTSLVFVTARTNVGTSPVDLDLIPSSSIARIEVLRDGAAAQYGSDAIAGVINIILKDGAGGSDGSLTLGRFGPKPDGIELGENGETVNLNVSQVFNFANEGFLRLNADISYQLGTNHVGEQARAGSLPRIYYPGDPREETASRYRQIQGLPTRDTWNFGYNLGAPVSDTVDFYSFGTASYQHSWNYAIYRTVGSPQNIPEVYPEGYTPRFVITTYDGQFVAGFRGDDLAGWDWDLSTSYSYSDAWEKNEKSLNPSLGPDSPRNFDNGHLITREWVSNFDVSRQFETGLFAGPLGFALGAEYRYNEFEYVAGQPESYISGDYRFPATILTGPLAGQPNPHFVNNVRPSGGASGLGGFSPDYEGVYDRNNVAVYAELSQDLTENWQVDLAARFEDYSDVGETTSAKFSTRWEIFDGFAVRGSVSTGFRAPSLQQLHYGSSLPNLSINPLDPFGPLVLLTTRYVPPTSAIGQALGATQLEPETSENLTVGFVWRPTSKITLTVDGYQIDIEDRILSTGSLRGATVNALLASIGEVPANVTFFTNAVDTRTTGVDIVGSWITDFETLGSVTWSLTSAFNHQKILEFAPTPAVLGSAVLFDRSRQGDLTVAYPRNRTTLGAEWSIGDFNINLRESWYSDVTWVDANTPLRDSTASGKFITDLDVRYAINEHVALTFGANNLFNIRPDEVNEQLQLNSGWPGANPYHNLFSPFGYNGGFYYGRINLRW